MLPEYLLLIGLSYGLALPSSHMHGPSFLEEPPVSLEFTNSSGAILNCIGQGNPVPEVRWVDITNKELITIPRLREKLNNGSLSFPPFSLHDFRSEIHQTVYRCILSNIIGSIVSRECKVRAEIVNLMDVQVSNVVAVKGNVAVMKCTAPIRTNQFSITWLKDDPKEGRSVVMPGNKYALTNSGELHIRDVNAEDSKMQFFCQMKCKLTGERYFSQPGHIVITETESSLMPKIEYSSANVQARVGEPVDLICVAQGYPPPVYRWFHKVSGMLQEIRSGAAVFVKPQLSVLQFSRVQVSDSSLYVCIASNNIGEDTREMKLTVYSPLITFIRPQKLVVDSGSQAMFNCSVQGSTGDWSLYWLKNGNRIQTSTNIELLNNGEILILKNVGRSDSGMYQCFAQNNEETAQASAELILGAVPPEFEDTFIEETMQPGLPVSLMCISDGNPPPRISWLLDGGHVQPADGVFIGTFLDSKGSVVGHLNITSTRLEYGGLYTCIARNFLGFVQHSAMLNIYGPPVSRQQLNLTAVSGTSVYLRCPVSGYPITSTTWFLDNKIITDQSSRKIFSNGTLLLTNLEEEKDKGKITCNVYNQQGNTASGVIYLNIIAPPEIMPFHISSNLKEGGKTNIVCSVTSGDLPITFMWRKDGKPVVFDSDIQEHLMDMVSTLRINNLSAKHSGHYTCIATNPASSTNYTAKLIVKASPTWSIEPQDTTILHRHSVVINCQANGFPVPRISWMKSKENKSNNFIPLEPNSRLFLYGNGSIEIKNAERQHEGFYTCQADNGIGTPISKTVFIKVNIPAHFRTKSMNQTGVVGQSVVLSCEAEGDFPIQLTWSSFINSAVYSKQMPTSEISELHIDRLTRQHAGIYRCTAINSFGYDHMIIFLSIKEPPEPPKDVNVLEAGSRWLRLNWTVDTSDNTHFIIQFRPMHESIWYNFTISDSFYNYQIENLLPNTLYLIKVIAVNEIGRSKPSTDIMAKTLQEVPSSYPLDLTVEKVNDDNVIIKWKVLSPEFWNGELLGYRIFYVENSRSSSSRSKTIRNVDANKFIIKNLRSYITYEISMRAFNQIGEGPSSPSLSVTTLESIPTGAPQNTECLPLSPESIRIRWRPPPQHYWNGILQSYKVSYQQSNPKAGARVFIDHKKTPSLEITVHGLEKYTNYSVRVSASTNAGEGIVSPYVQCTTLEDVPGAPDEIKALVMSSDSILLVWTAPKDPGGKIIRYNIYMQSDNEGSRKETVFGDNNRRYEFRRLTENHRYEFWITACTAIGEGQSSVKVARILSSKIPPKISSFSRTIIGVTNSHLTLECNAVGLPTPTRLWKKFNNLLSLADIKILFDKSLWIPELKVDDAGNYTCIAENVFGDDKISYEVVVVEVPTPPTLFLVSTTKNSITLKWKDLNDGGCPILGYVIISRCDNEEIFAHVEPDKSSYTFMNLKCGTKYQFSIQSINSIGRSNLSNSVNAKTKGDVPETFNENELFFINATTVTLFLDGWPERECPAQYFKVSYKVEENWIFVGKGHLFPQPVTISNLIPATLYTVRVGVFNEVGKIFQNFVITTRSASGEIIPIELIGHSKMSIMAQLNFIIPLISGIICLISLSVCIVILWHRKKLYNEYKSGDTTLNTSRIELESQVNVQRAQLPSQKSSCSPAHIHKSSGLSMQKDAGVNDYDVYPYATFTVPNQLQTFTYRDCNEGNVMMSENTHSMQRKRRNNSKNLTDTMSLEIACISNQQTLPIGKKTGFGTISSTFNEHDVNPISRQKKYYMKRNADMSYDSSTESPSEISPENSRRHKTRSVITSRDSQKQYKNLREFSDGCDIDRIDVNEDEEELSSLELPQHEKFNQELTSIVNEYRKRRTITSKKNGL